MTPPPTDSRPRLFAGSAAVPANLPRPVLTIGNFDGLHRGHRHLLAQVRAEAQRLGAPVWVYTFDPPPRVVLAPQHRQPRICPWPEKVAMLGTAGVDVVVLERFTRAFAQHPADWFADEIIGRRLRPRAVVVGYDFRFGRARAGTVDHLRRRLPSLPVSQVEALELDGAVVSSTRIRGLVANGEVEQAARLMARPHSIRGVVIPGDQRGRTIGFPTANLELDAELVPPTGVYAVRARVDSGEWRPAIANLGVRPTFDGGRFLVEVHLFDFRGDLYGRQMDVAFVGRIRGERRFASSDELVAQIRDDVVVARTVLEDEATA